MIFELNEVKRLRKGLNLTQKELAKLSGVSQSLIAKVESGGIDPTFSKATKIFEALRTARHSQMKAGDVTNNSIISVSPVDSIEKAIRKMKKYNISQMPVIQDKEVLGLIDEATILEALIGSKNSDTEIRDVMTDAPPIISKKASMDSVHQLLREYSIVLVSENGKLKGHITKADLLIKTFR